MEYIETTLSLIHPSPTNPRKSFPAEEMAEMIDSVKRHGILQPILIRPWPRKYVLDGQYPAYELVAGDRRYRAAKAAELESIPVMVRDLSDHEVLEIQIIENLQRKGLHPIEEAESYELMIRDHGYTADQLAEKIGKSRAYIYGRMKLTALCTQARLAFHDGKLTASTALLIARIPGAKLQEKALDKITATWQGVLSYRHAAEVVQSDFCFYLDQAPFPQENALLAPLAGVCSTCPKRSGTDPSLFPDIERADVCTDPDCYQAKVQAWLAYQKSQAKEAGKKVIGGDEAKKINIAYSHDKFVPLERRNYEIDGAPTYRETVEKTDVETVMIEDHASGKLVEAVERKALASALVAAGLKPERDYRHEERELERRTRAENEFRKRLFQAWHNEMRAQLDNPEEQPDFEIDELRLVASTLWSNLYGENYEVVAGYWAAPSKEKESWSRRHVMVREVADRIPQMERRQLILFMLDCALSHNARASQHSVDTPPTQLIEHARHCGIDAERIRNEIEAEKAAKASKKSPAKSASTPLEAPRGEAPEPAVRPYVLEAGDRVQIKPESELLAKGKLGYFRGYAESGQAIVWLDGEPASYLCCPDELDAVPITDNPSAILEPSNVKIKCEYAHPQNRELQWSGRGKKPKWVEHWLAEAGNTLDQLRVISPEDQSSAPRGANAKPCVAEAAPRCAKTLELPLA